MTQDVTMSDVQTVPRPPKQDDLTVGSLFLVDRYGVLMWARISGVHPDKRGGWRITWVLYESPESTRPLLGNPRINDISELEVVAYQGVTGVRKAVHVPVHVVRREERTRLALAAMSGDATIPEHLCPACGMRCSHSGEIRGLGHTQ